MKAIKYSLLLIILSGFGFLHAQDQENVLYLHPITLIYSTAGGSPWIFATYEHFLKESVSLVAMPEIYIGSDGFIGGIGGGLRKYLSGEQTGAYLQARAKYHRLSSEDSYGNSLAMNMFSLLGYFGTKKQWGNICSYSDVGIGFAAVSGGMNIEGLDAVLSGSGFWFDINWALGYAF